MLKKVAGIVSILYFIYFAYISIMNIGLSGIHGLLYFLPYLLAGILLITDKHRIIAAIMGASILLIQFYLTGFSISSTISRLMNPMDLVFSVILPILIIYTAIKE